MKFVVVSYEKRQRTAALQDAPRGSESHESPKVLECGSPLPLFGLMIIAWLLFACSALSANFSISMVNNRFIPNTLTINVGDTVTWTDNQGQHDTVSGSGGVPNGVWNSDNQYHRLMFPGESFSFTFATGGTFPFYCTPHWPLGMTGTIT